MQIVLSPIGFVRGGRTTLVDDDWDAVESSIVVDPSFSTDCLMGLSQFSHALIVYYFDRVSPEKIELSARHPRNNSEWPLVGIFAQRGKNRPNQLGVSTCRILTIEGHTVFVRGLDAVDGTPILDIKPVFKEFEVSEAIRQPEWTTELMQNYWNQKDAEQTDAANSRASGTSGTSDAGASAPPEASGNS